MQSTASKGEPPLRGQAYMLEQSKSRLSVLEMSAGGRPRPMEWYCLNDIVMGGRSSSQVERTAEGSMRFSGVIDTNGGGFASCRTFKFSDAHLDRPEDSTGVNVAISGGNMQSHAFKFTMAASSLQSIDEATLGEGMKGRRRANWEKMPLEQRRAAMQDINWQCMLPAAAADTPTRVHLPYSEFTASLYGQRLHGLELDSRTISHVGLNVGVFDADGRPDERFGAGPFEITIHGIQLGGKHSALGNGGGSSHQLQ
jgi:hypothetical protein